MRWLLCGTALAACGLGHDGRSLLARRPAPGPVAHWVADRDGHRLVGLDADLYVARRVELRWPCRIAPGPGGVWVCASLEGRPGGAYRVLHLGPHGVDVEALVDDVRALARDRDGTALVLASGPEGARLLRLDAAGPRVLDVLSPGATTLGLGGGRALVGFRSGALLGLVPGGDGVGPADRSVITGHVDGAVRDVVPGPRGGWWVLADGAVLHRLDARLVPLGRLALPFEHARLARGAGSSGIWVVDGGGGRAARVEADGRGWTVDDLPLAGFEAARSLPGGGCLAGGGGAVLRLASDGRVVAGQGGLTFVAGL